MDVGTNACNIYSSSNRVLKLVMPKLALSAILIIVLGLHIGNYIDQNLLSQMKDWIWTSIDYVFLYFGKYINSIKISSKIF